MKGTDAGTQVSQTSFCVHLLAEDDTIGHYGALERPSSLNKMFTISYCSHKMYSRYSWVFVAAAMSFYKIPLSPQPAMFPAMESTTPLRSNKSWHFLGVTKEMPTHTSLYSLWTYHHVELQSSLGNAVFPCRQCELLEISSRTWGRMHLGEDSLSPGCVSPPFSETPPMPPECVTFSCP